MKTAVPRRVNIRSDLHTESVGWIIHLKTHKFLIRIEICNVLRGNDCVVSGVVRAVRSVELTQILRQIRYLLLRSDIFFLPAVPILAFAAHKRSQFIVSTGMHAENLRKSIILILLPI